MKTAKTLKLVGQRSSDIPDHAWFYSCKVWPHNESHRMKWLAAVQYLRTTKKGWHIDNGPERLKRIT